VINFRFHLASLIAVFLALALGIVMGSTVIKSAIVDGLNNRIDRVENKAESRKRENDGLRAEQSRLEEYVAQNAGFAVTDRLKGIPVALVATRGVAGDTVKAQVQLLEQAGATVSGILWVEGPWALKNGDVDKMARALGETSRNDKTLRDAAWKALAERFAAGQAQPAAVGPPGATSAGDPLAALVAAGFLKLEPVSGASSGVDLSVFPGSGARVLVVGGSGAAFDAADFLKGAAKALSAAKVPTVAAEAFEVKKNGPDRGTVVSGVRDDEGLSAAVSTVDDVELGQGRVADALALSDLGRGVVGHYGYGVGAKSTVPPWSRP
jgi:hypothetical protein